MSHPNEQRPQVLVVHGGLFDRDDVTLDELRAIDRHCEPPVQGLMCDLLWADPKVRFCVDSINRREYILQRISNDLSDVKAIYREYFFWCALCLLWLFQFSFRACIFTIFPSFFLFFPLTLL